MTDSNTDNINHAASRIMAEIKKTHEALTDINQTLDKICYALEKIAEK